MTNKDRDLINQITSEIISLNNIKIPLEVDIFVELLGGKYELVEEILEEGIFKQADGSFLIKLYSSNPTKPISPHRKTILLECIGHLILYLDYLRDGWNNLEEGKLYYSKSPADVECAREFGLSLLMPKDILRSQKGYNYAIYENGYINVQAIADYFGVDYNSTLWRGISLHLWEIIK